MFPYLLLENNGKCFDINFEIQEWLYPLLKALNYVANSISYTENSKNVFWKNAVTSSIGLHGVPSGWFPMHG